MMPEANRAQREALQFSFDDITVGELIVYLQQFPAHIKVGIKPTQHESEQYWLPFGMICCGGLSYVYDERKKIEFCMIRGEEE